MLAMADATGEFVTCPVCDASVAMHVIEKHVDECLNSNKLTPVGKAASSQMSGTVAGKKRPSKSSPSNLFSSKLSKSHQTASPALHSFPKSASGSSRSDNTLSSPPLYEIVRPTSLEDFVGQDTITGKGSLVERIVDSGRIPSLIFWGPPGCGKTTLARLVACSGRSKSNMRFVQLSGTTSGLADVKEAVKVAKNDKKMFRKGTILFVDEIHRFNKLQQDSFLPHIEDGTITLLGATTENPSFSLNSALLSRCHVMVLNKLSVDDIQSILWRTAEAIDVVEYCTGTMKDTPKTELVEPGKLYIDPKAIRFLSEYCDGDARIAIKALHLAIQLKNSPDDNNKAESIVNIDDVKNCLQRSHLLYDKSGDEHYNLISALIKSMRGSDASAALYWLARMLTAGEDPLYIARRVIVFASEDIGLADSNALNQAVSAYHACKFIGMPECELNLSQAVIYMARASKSRCVINAYQRAKKAVSDHKGPLPCVPLHLRNAPTKLMKDLGYGERTSDVNSFLPPEIDELNFFDDD